jgi:outer membrane protein OmpA-like peptidoglycan-associated protein
MIRTIFAVFIFLSSFGFSQITSVYFKFNKYDLSSRAKEKIDSILKIPNIQKIVLQGHTDSIGGNNYNDGLSARRVNEVKHYMLTKNTFETLIEIKALGKRVALNKNMNERERALNRRVEIELVLKPVVVTKPKDSINTISKTPLSKYEVEIMINGIVLDEKNEPLIAEVTLTDKNGKEIKTILSDQNGKYNFKAVVNKREDYNLTFYNDSTFVSARAINVSNPRMPYKNLSNELLKIKCDRRYILENLNFEGDTSQLVAASLPSLEALYKLMKKNKHLHIRIEGHVNFPHHWGNPKGIKARSIRYVPPGMNYEQFNQWLSDDRAKSVYKFLLKKGIDANRMSTIGFGSSKMLFPDAESDSEMAQNRRVEINVICNR